MASTNKVIADDSFRQLLFVISEWYDKRGHINNLKVLYTDHIGTASDLYTVTKTIDLLNLLISHGHLSTTDLTILFDTINATKQFGLVKKITSLIPSCPNVKDIVISNFSLHRQKLIKLGMTLRDVDVAKISSLHYTPVKQFADSWSLIMDLEHEIIIREENMGPFIDKLNRLQLPLAVEALTEGGEQTELDNVDKTLPSAIIPSGGNKRKTIPLVPPVATSTSKDSKKRKTRPLVPPVATSTFKGFQQGSWCEEKKCFRFSQDEIKKMKRDKIGEGGFGIVHKGYWIQNAKPNGLPVAIKEYNEEIAKESGQGDEQFEKELNAVQISKHCFAVTVLGYCHEGKYKAIVYPYMEKGDLKRLLDNNDPALTWEIRIRLLYQICRAMCHFHNSFNSRVGSGVVHGDVKADNIFLDKHLNAFLGDFGVSETLPDDRTSITRMDKPSAMGYKDPDAVKHLSMSSDVYMFGVVIFRCLTSEAAQQGDDAPECESLAPKKRSHIEESYEELYTRVDRGIWKHNQDHIAKGLAELAIKCFIRKRNQANRCTFKEILMNLDNLMEKEPEPIPAYLFEENADTRCICCRLYRPTQNGNSNCKCPSVVCSDCLQNKDLPCPFHVSSRIRASLSY